MRQSGRKALVLAAVLAAALVSEGCAAKWAYRKGKSEAKKGNWDLAVARFTKALREDPDNIGYKIALESAKVQASRYHYAEAQEAPGGGRAGEGGGRAGDRHASTTPATSPSSTS